MGSTPYYVIPYPESTDAPDGPTQMRAIADKVEALLKNGFTMLTGSFAIGDPASTSQRLLTLRMSDGGFAYEMRMAVPAGGGGWNIDATKAGASVCALMMRPTGALTTTVGSTSRPLPFAMFTASQSIPTGAGGASITLPAGRFTVAPTCAANIYGTTAYNANAAIISTTSVNVVTNAAASATCDVICIQMTPSGAGLLRQAPPIPKSAVTRTATCHTEGCENAEEPLEVVSITDETLIVCGVCGTDIADVAGGTAAARRKASRKGSEPEDPGLPRRGTEDPNHL